ncbi:hypothetical protein KSF73_01650 [Burkholderiaceae bacterium DAT-1]|nr:hypothetical protein [Burkholderiaceae bacterium DAT-1]
MDAPRTLSFVLLMLTSGISQAGLLTNAGLGNSIVTSREAAWLNQMPTQSLNNTAVQVHAERETTSAKLVAPLVEHTSSPSFGLAVNTGLGSQVVCVSNNRDAGAGVGIGWSSNGGFRFTLQGRGMYQFAQLMRAKPLRNSCKDSNDPVCRTLMITRCN